MLPLVLLILGSYSVPGIARSGPVTLENAHVRIVITPDLQLVRPGSLLEFTDLATGTDMAAGGQFGGIQSDVFIPSTGTITCLSDTEAVFQSPFMYDHTGSETIPVETTILYRLAGRGLEMVFTVETTGETEFLHPLEVDFHMKAWETATFMNQTTECDRQFDLQAEQGPARVSGDQVVLLHTEQPYPLSAKVLFPNPSKANLVITAHSPTVPAYLSLRLFDVDQPRENCLGPDLHSVIPAGDSSSYYVGFSLEENAAPVFISDHPHGYERTASWMLDEIPMIHPDAGYIWSFSETSSGPEILSAQLIQLLEEHPEMKMNWLVLPDGILTPNRDSVWFEPGWEDSWSHWHCTWRISTEATPEFRQWLLNIQEDAYTWADRVNLGSHGYHHTPNPDSSFGEFHEFITYEPEEHFERFAMLNSDICDMGLDPGKVCRAIRYAGHRTSLSGLWATISAGFDFYCNGIRWWDWNAGEYFRDTYISKFQTPEGRIWGTNTVWWADYQSMYPYEYLSSVMTRGKHGLLGGHPGQMLAMGLVPEAYQRLDSVCTSLETDYQHFGWLFPIEYGDFLEECYGMLWENVEYSPGGLSLSFNGAATLGETLVIFLPEDAVVYQLLLDGQPLDWEVREGERLFAVLPSISAGQHSLSVTWDITGISGLNTPPDAGISIPSPVFGAAYLRASGLPSYESWTASVYDLSGRTVTESGGITGNSGSLEFCLGMDTEPRGLYLVRLVAGGMELRSRFVYLGG